MASTNWIYATILFVFFSSVAVMTSLVSADITLSSTNQSLTNTINDARSDSGFISGVFLTLATTTIDSVDDFGEDYGDASLMTRILIGFGTLPDWLNLMFAVLAIIFTLTLIIAILPGVG